MKTSHHQSGFLTFEALMTLALSMAFIAIIQWFVSQRLKAMNEIHRGSRILHEAHGSNFRGSKEIKITFDTGKRLIRDPTQIKAPLQHSIFFDFGGQ